MAANVEVKAWLPNLGVAIERLRSLSATDPEVLSQDDHFYGVPRGRLKMRSEADGRCELVYYRRDNARGPRVSSYFRESLDDPIAKDAELRRRFGRGVNVRKERLVFILRGVRIHLDTVEGLGNFIEIEVPVTLPSEYPRAHALAANLLKELEIAESDLVAESYEELLARRESERRSPSS